MPAPVNSDPRPEKVLQFGTGILLRGLPDYFINKANQVGLFGGSIVVVKSTPGPATDFQDQPIVFTTCIRGIEHGKKVEDDVVNAAISRVLTAEGQWGEILGAGSQPSLQIIISNTTEIGIQFEAESIHQNPPRSFPAKLTAVLYERYKQLGNRSGDVCVIPTELIPENGKLLGKLVKQVAEHNMLEEGFGYWLSQKIIFCDSLVDRIVTRPSESVKASLPSYHPLTIQAEPYRLWAIAGGGRVRNLLTFAQADEGVVVADDIDYYRERKIRLLNGTHTISVCLGFLRGLNTVYECMQDATMSKFIRDVMLVEIQPTLTLGSDEMNRQFAEGVLDRFGNPYTAHQLLNITFQSTAKMKMRNLPTLFRYAQKFSKAPLLMAHGFAAYLLFMRITEQDGSNFFGRRKGERYPVRDDQAGYYVGIWKEVDSGRLTLSQLVQKVCSEVSLWDKDLSILPGFVSSVTGYLENMIKENAS